MIGKHYEAKNNYLNAFLYYRFSTEQNAGASNYRDAFKKTNIFKRYFELRAIITGEPVNTDYNEEFRKKTTKDFEKGDPTKDPLKSLDNGKSGGIKGNISADSILTGEDSTFTIVDTSHTKEKQISAAKFELAELFLYDLNRMDSSEIYLKQALNESFDYDFSAKVLFALSELYRKQDNNVKSEEVLNTIVRDYPRSPVANSSRKLLNMSMVDEFRGDASDSIYSSAENKFINKDYRAALDDFIVLISVYPSSVHLDKAYFGAGWIYENIVYNNDSAYYYYSSLVKGVPNSEAAAIVMQKVEEYETFNKTNVIDTTGTNIQQNNEINNVPEKKEEVEPKEGDIDPSMLKKEFEKNDPEKKVNIDDQGNEEQKKSEENLKKEELIKDGESPGENPPGN